MTQEQILSAVWHIVSLAEVTGEQATDILEALSDCRILSEEDAREIAKNLTH